MDLRNSRSVEAAREAPYLTIGGCQRACSRRERRRSLITQATFNVSGSPLGPDGRQMLAAGVVAGHEGDLLADGIHDSLLGMKQWVEYCNATQGAGAAMRTVGGHVEPLNVRYWSIGNENWGDHEIGMRTPEAWGPLVSRSAELMRSADPRITLIAAATANRDWTLPLLGAAGAHLDYIAIHEYWLGYWRHNAMPDYLTCIMHSAGPERSIDAVIEVLEEAGFRGRIKIAFDEWNLRGWHHPGFPRKEAVQPNDKAAAESIKKRDINAIARQYTMADALFSASFLNACLRRCNDVGMANIAPIVNTRGPLYVHPEGIVRRTTFHVLAMYANLLETHVGKVDVQTEPLTHGGRSVPVVDAVATVDGSSRRWSIALVNRHPAEPAACTVRAGEALPDGPYDATVLVGDSPEAYNHVPRPDRVAPEKRKLTITDGALVLPPHSLTILRVATAKTARPAGPTKGPPIRW